MVFSEVQFLKAPEPMLVSCDPDSKWTLVRLDAPWKVSALNWVTVAGMEMDCKLVQP